MPFQDNYIKESFMGLKKIISHNLKIAKILVGYNQTLYSTLHERKHNILLILFLINLSYVFTKSLSNIVQHFVISWIFLAMVRLFPLVLVEDFGNIFTFRIAFPFVLSLFFCYFINVSNIKKSCTNI